MAEEDEVSPEQQAYYRVMELAKTDPKAADAELVRIRHQREALASAESFLDDREGAEVTEHLDEINVFLHEEPIEILERQKTELSIPLRIGDAESDSSEAGSRRALVRAKLAEIDGGVAISPDDPLATEKKKVANKLKKVGRTLNDLPPDWDKLPETAKIPGERSRRNELYRVLEEGKAEMHEAARLRELELGGRPENYDRLSRAERERVEAKLRKRRQRAKESKSASKPTGAPLPIAHVAPDGLRHTLIVMQHKLEKWASGSNEPRPRQFRNRKRQLVLIRAALWYFRFFQQHQRCPSHAELGRWLRCSTDQARRRLDRLKALYAAGGPWADQ
jgi:hypothetical protein